MPVANTGVSAYGWWRSSTYIKTLHADFPQLEVDQVIEAVRVAGPEDSAVRNYLCQQYASIKEASDLNVNDSNPRGKVQETLTTIFRETSEGRLVTS